MAFCRWLTKKLSYQIRLPTEQEWVYAATGGDQKHLYPWGTEPDTARANTSESHLVRTTAVGMYPYGAAPCGALDMSGNVWEWILHRNEGKMDKEMIPSSTAFVRGGSFLSPLDLARVSSYRKEDKDSRGSLFGFRVVASAPFD
jgi:formylglycine-generating enzyme required for sulfatase activity